jgi:uncharacterized repeat protein (TIGR01451 family)
MKFSTGTNGLPFYAIAQIDTGPESDKGNTYDWGFPLLPSSQLTSQAVVGRGEGCTSPDCLAENIVSGASGYYSLKLPRNVVWVTPLADAYIFVDFEGDGVWDTDQRVPMLKSYRIWDPDDLDMTGAFIYATSSISGALPSGSPVLMALAWGQDPTLSGGSDSEALDLGTLVLPLGNPAVFKNVVKVVNPDGSLDPNKIVDQVGDVIVYEILIANVGFSDLTSVTVIDLLITASAGGSKTVTGPVEIPATGMTQNGVLNKGDTFIYGGSYTIQPSDIASNGGGNGNIENSATVTTSTTPPVVVTVETPIKFTEISGYVREDINNNGLGGITSGDNPLSKVLITLGDLATGTIIATTLTDTSGFYKFSQLQGGNYFVAETNPAGLSDAADFDGGTNLSNITVAGVVGGKTYGGRDFVDYKAPPSSPPTPKPTSPPSPSTNWRSHSCTNSCAYTCTNTVTHSRAYTCTYSSQVRNRPLYVYFTKSSTNTCANASATDVQPWHRLLYHLQDLHLHQRQYRPLGLHMRSHLRQLSRQHFNLRLHLLATQHLYLRHYHRRNLHFHQLICLLRNHPLNQVLSQVLNLHLLQLHFHPLDPPFHRLPCQALDLVLFPHPNLRLHQSRLHQQVPQRLHRLKNHPLIQHLRQLLYLALILHLSQLVHQVHDRHLHPLLRLLTPQVHGLLQD